MSNELPLSALVVGAGPAGLVLALTLLQNGLSVRIIDKEPIFRPGHRGAGLQPRTLEVFNFLGVLDDVLAQAIQIGPRRVYKLPGGIEPLKTAYLSPRQEPTPSAPFGNARHLGQYHTEEILRSHIEKYNCHVELGVELRGLEQHQDSVIARLIRKHGQQEIEETVACHWLAGTDGAKSIVRNQLGLGFLGETHEDRHIVVAEVGVEGLDRDYWHSWGDMSTKMVMLRPTENPGMFYMIAGGQIDHAQVIAHREELLRFIYAATDRQDLKIGEIKWISEFRPNIRMVDTFRKERVFLAGDAAHVHSPTGGQGLNSSLQDSFNLGWKLALVEKGLAGPSLLDTYTEERLPVIASMLQKTTQLLGLLTMAKVGTADDDVAWKRGGQLNQMGVNYRWSSIVLDQCTPYTASVPQDMYGGAGREGLRAGDRAPDAPDLHVVAVKRGVTHVASGGESTSLFQIFHPTYHTVLILAQDARLIQLALEAVKKYPRESIRTAVVFPRGASDVPAIESTDLVLVDRGGHAYSGYAVSLERPITVVVRPDGVVGAIVLDEEGLRDYFGRIFAK